MFSLLVGASVRLRRPDHQATLHFFWLTVAFFGVMAFSFTGQARRARLDVLLGRPDRAAAAAAAVPALRARLPRSARRLGAQRHRAARWCRRSTCRRCCSARCRSRRDQRRGARRGADARRRLVQVAQLRLSRDQPRRRAGDHGARAAAGALGHRAPPAALDRLGHGARLGAVRLRLRAAVRVRAAAAARASSSARCCSA